MYNYTLHWGYLWNEITLPVTYESDWQRAAEIMMEHSETYTREIQDDAEAQLSTLVERFPPKDTKVEPTLYLAMTDNWIELTVRFVVDANQRRTTKDRLYQGLLQQFLAEENIDVASTTIEIVGFPPLTGMQENG